VVQAAVVTVQQLVLLLSRVLSTLVVVVVVEKIANTHLEQQAAQALSSLLILPNILTSPSQAV
jgi:hypothetical protein